MNRSALCLEGSNAGLLVENPLGRVPRGDSGLVGEPPGPDIVGVTGMMNPSSSASFPMSF